MGSVSVQIFEGIASVDLDGVGHDAYMSIHTESVGYTIRWFGTFEWMGERPETFPSVPSVRDVVLSDGRECKIRIPYGPPSGGRFEFLGIGNPPGFEWFVGETVETELKSSTPTWRVVTSRFLGFLSFLCIIASIWVEDYEWNLVLSGLVTALLAVQVAPKPARRPLPEVPNDVPRG